MDIDVYCEYISTMVWGTVIHFLIIPGLLAALRYH